jgi:RNA polymerase sigma factor (sigma-70 family)
MNNASETTAAASTPSPGQSAASSGSFVATRWTVVLAAGHKEGPEADAALEQLCRVYWYPLYAYARRLGQSCPDAQDLTQEFFARLLAKNYLAAVVRDRGRFRSFLLMAFKRFLADEWDKARAGKRGGGQKPLSLDTSTAEIRYQAELVEDLTPEHIFEHRWALALLEQAMTRLQAEFERAGKAVEFERLKVFLTAEKGALRPAEVAPALGLSDGALRVAIHRLRRRFREVFREEIAQTVARPEEVEEEIRHLLAVLSR